MEKFSGTFNFVSGRKAFFFFYLSLYKQKGVVFDISWKMSIWETLEHITFVRLYKYMDRQSILTVTERNYSIKDERN